MLMIETTARSIKLESSQNNKIMHWINDVIL